MFAAINEWATGVGGLVLALAAFVTAVAKLASTGVWKRKARRDPSGVVSVQAAVDAFNSIITAQDSFEKNLLERVERLEDHVQACEDEKLMLREALAEARRS